MSIKFLGSFLVEKKIITQAQLEEALLDQRRNNIRLGTLALQKGYMTDKQVDETLLFQKSSSKKFGQIAVAKQFISLSELEDILTTQAENHIYLGEILVKKNFVPGDRLNGYIAEYHRETAKNNIIFEQKLDSVPVKELLKPALELTLNFFYRFGLKAKPDSILSMEELPGILTGREMFKFIVKQELEGNQYYFGLLLPVESFEPVIKILLRDKPVALGFDEKIELFAEAVFIINSIFCKNMQKKGTKIKSGKSVPEPPPEFNQVMVKIETISAPFYCAYYWEQQ